MPTPLPRLARQSVALLTSPLGFFQRQPAVPAGFGSWPGPMLDAVWLSLAALVFRLLEPGVLPPDSHGRSGLDMLPRLALETLALGQGLLWLLALALLGCTILSGGVTRMGACLRAGSWLLHLWPVAMLLSLLLPPRLESLALVALGVQGALLWHLCLATHLQARPGASRRLALAAGTLAMLLALGRMGWRAEETAREMERMEAVRLLQESTQAARDRYEALSRQHNASP